MATLKDYLYYQDNWVTDYCGDAREILKGLPEKSIQMCVTSPPYWGLRDYGLEPLVWGGDGCEHRWGDKIIIKRGHPGDKSTLVGTQTADISKAAGKQGQFCQLCNAWRGSLGLEPTPALYVQHLVEIFRLVKRVLRDDGTVWLNMGDSYASNWGSGAKRNSSWWSTQSGELEGKGWGDVETTIPPNMWKKHPNIKTKDLIGIPWRLAFALQADGWYLRSDIVWSKPNPMPESCTDRPTKAHEYVFLLSKKAKYFYDADAVKEPHKRDFSNEGGGWESGEYKPKENTAWKNDPLSLRGANQTFYYNPAGRNKRTVWTIATQPTCIPHFAAFPEKLVEPCILAGTSEKGCCPECGSPWERVVEKGELKKLGTNIRPTPMKGLAKSGQFGNRAANMTRDGFIPSHQRETTTIGWQPTCKCKPSNDWKRAGGTVRCTVLDPFAGTGTVGKVARDHFRKSILIDIKQEYFDMAVKRFKEEIFDFR